MRAEYLQVATGDINDTVDQYRTHERRELSTAESNLVRQERAGAGRGPSRPWPARQQALAQAAADQAQLNQLQQQLNQDIEAAAVARPTSRPPPRRPPPRLPRRRRRHAAQGLPVNNGLVAVVHTIVAPPPAPTPAPTPVPAKAAPAPGDGAAHDRPAAPEPRPAAPVPATAPGYTPSGGVWLQLRECESGDNYAENTGNGYYGAYQFSQQTWTGLGLPAARSGVAPDPGCRGGHKLQAEAGWGAWPACSIALGPALTGRCLTTGRRGRRPRPGPEPPRAPATPCLLAGLRTARWSSRPSRRGGRKRVRWP